MLSLPASLMTRPDTAGTVARYVGVPVPQVPAPPREELLRLLEVPSVVRA